MTWRASPAPFRPGLAQPSLPLPASARPCYPRRMRRLLSTALLSLTLLAGAQCKRTAPRESTSAPTRATAEAPMIPPPAADMPAGAGGAAAQEGKLPPGHPPLDGGGAPAAKGELPPGHPPLGGSSGSAMDGAEMPAMGETTGGAAGPSMADQHRAAASGPSGVAVKKVERAAGPQGRTVAEVWAQRAKLANGPVAVRGQVVKSTEVMGRHFLHLRDGSGTVGKDDDLTVTSQESIPVGEVVTLQGKVAVDLDLGAGYRYPVIVEDAQRVGEGL